jgi:hypothetical protein
MFTHESILIGSLIQNRGSAVLVLRLADDIKNGLPGFDGIQFEAGRVADPGYYRGRWGYSEDTERILGPVGSRYALEYATAAARALRSDPARHDDWLLDDLLAVFPNL